MAQQNLMNYFIVGEDGTSSFLATLFDRKFRNKLQERFWKAFSQRLTPAVASLSENGPSTVRREYEAMDLVMVWDKWAIILENKISSASVTRHQLQRYYDSSLARVSRGSFLKGEDSRVENICLIYLTPTQDTGTIEFDSLQVNHTRGDVKVHLSWSDILVDIDAVLHVADSSDPYVALLRDGRDVTRKLIKANVERGPKVQETEERKQMKLFISEVEQLIRDMMVFELDLRLSIWRDIGVDELYGNIHGRNGNVFLDLWEEGTNLLNGDQATIHASFVLKVANKAPKVYKTQFLSYPPEHWSAILGVNSYQLTVDKTRHTVKNDIEWTGNRDDLIRQTAALFCRGLTAFRPFMADGLIA